MRIFFITKYNGNMIYKNLSKLLKTSCDVSPKRHNLDTGHAAMSML